jgi:hypothetical protein
VSQSIQVEESEGVKLALGQLKTVNMDILEVNNKIEKLRSEIYSLKTS